MENVLIEKDAISQALQKFYFDGLYDGNVDLLHQIFYPGALVLGDIKGAPYSKTLIQYLDGVANRVPPRDSGKPYTTEIISVDVINSIAAVKLRVKMYDFNYYDFLSFHKVDGRWLIVNKLLTDVTE